MQDLSTSSSQHLAHTCTSASHASFFQVLSLGCPCFCRLTIDMAHENYFMTQVLQKMFRHHSVVRAYNSASAQLKLTVCCVLDHAVRDAFHHCTNSPLVLLHVVACPAQSLSVYTFTNFEGVMISIRLFAPGALFKYLTIRFRFISSLSVGHVIFLAVFLHAVHDICSFLAHVQQFSHNCSVHCSSFTFQLNEPFCRWRPLHTWSHHGLCFFQSKNIHHVSDVLRIRFHRVSSCLSLNHSVWEIIFSPVFSILLVILIKICFDEFNQFQNFIFRSKH